MTEPMDVIDDYSTVGFGYRANLERRERFAVKGTHQIHRMSTAGRVHPKPYTMDAAVTLVARKLEPLLGLEWQITSLVVTAYDEKDA